MAAQYIALPSGLHLATLAKRPDLIPQAQSLMQTSWPEFMLHDPVGIRHFDNLYTLFPDYQLALSDESDHLIGLGNSIPFRWNCPEQDLPEGGWVWVLEQGMKDHEAGLQPNFLSALSVTLSPEVRGRALSAPIVQALGTVARERAFRSLVVPLRPTWKERHPHMPFDQYIHWKRADGQPYDPWLRVHIKLGAEIVGVATRSMVIRGTVQEWQAWTGLRFNKSGSYPVPGALVPLEVDLERNEGLYVEPNVWLRHPV